MSVLITGMKMPSSCIECPMQFGGMCYVQPPEIDQARVFPTVDECNGRTDWCPLVEIPKPHGRLIDADAYCEFCKDDCHWRIGDDPSCEFCHMPNAPTIIESETGDS